MRNVQRIQATKGLNLGLLQPVETAARCKSSWGTSVTSKQLLVLLQPFLNPGPNTWFPPWPFRTLPKLQFQLTPVSCNFCLGVPVTPETGVASLFRVLLAKGRDGGARFFGPAPPPPRTLSMNILIQTWDLFGVCLFARSFSHGLTPNGGLCGVAQPPGQELVVRSGKGGSAWRAARRTSIRGNLFTAAENQPGQSICR